jgi:uncharacterized protein
MATEIQKEVLDEDPVLPEIVERLVRAYEPESVYLFGSKGRGDYGADSDYDLLLVAPDDAPPERQRSRLAYGTRGLQGRGEQLMCWCARVRISMRAAT